MLPMRNATVPSQVLEGCERDRGATVRVSSLLTELDSG